MKVVKRTVTPTFTPITLEITLESQQEFDQFNTELQYINKYIPMPLSFSLISRELLVALKK